MTRHFLFYRETDDVDAKNPHREQEEWEKHQISAATMTYGAKDKKAVNPEYDFVFEDQIDFVKTEALAGTLVRVCTRRSKCKPISGRYLVPLTRVVRESRVGRRAMTRTRRTRP